MMFLRHPRFYFWFLLSVLPLTATAQQTRTYYLDSAEDLFRANLDITGGEERWRDISTIRLEAQISGQIDDFPLEGIRISISKFPGYRYVEQQVLNGGIRETYKLRYTPERAWIEQDGKKSLVPQDESPSLLQAKEELAFLEAEDLEIEAFERTYFNNKRVFKVVFTRQGTTYTRYYDRQNLLLVGTETPLNDGSVVTTWFSDYREVKGLLFPFQISVFTPNVGGRQVYHISRITLNIEVNVSQLFLFR